MKSIEVPNPRRNSACDCTCVLTRNRSLSISWFSHRACHAHSVLFLPMQSSLTSFWRSFTGLVQLIFSFPSWFHTIWFYCSHAFHGFLSQITPCFSFAGLKDMITAFTSWSSALQVQKLHTGDTFVGGIVYLRSYCQWPIIELTKNVSPSLA